MAFVRDSLGEAYQVADDVRDVIGDMQSLGKPIGKDELDRPSATRELGLSGAVEIFDHLVEKAVHPYRIAREHPCYEACSTGV
jgi:geranylgeranyl diphosphate synthase type II